MPEITALNPHIVVRDAARAADWYRTPTGCGGGRRAAA
jgi:hypothetical protein